jgi:hypothetical protein
MKMSWNILPHLTSKPNVPPSPKEEEKSLREQYLESQKNAFFREVEEDVKAEKAAIFWNKYKKYIISVISVVLLWAVVDNWYENYKSEIVLKEANRFERIISDTKITSEGKILELKEFSNEAKFGYKDVALLNAFSLEMELGKYEDGVATLKKLIAESTDKMFENVALVKLAGLASSMNVDDLSKIKEMLLSVGKSKPLFATSQFMLGVIYLKEHKYDDAKIIFDKISDDEDLPVSLKSESLTMLNFIKSSMAN